MRKFTVLLIAGIAAISGLAKAQTIDFDLSDYKLPDLERRSLDLDFSLSGNQGQYHFDSEHANFFQTDKSKHASFSNELNLRYHYFKNSLLHQRNYIYRLNNRLQYQSSDRGQGSEIWNLMTPSVRANLQNRWFYGGEQNFLSYDLLLNQHYYRSSYRQEEAEGTTRYVRNSFQIHAPLKIGRGRIEPVQDARHAVYLFQELADIGRMSHEKSPEEIIRLATLISELKNERFFDARLKQIFELEALDSFLLDHDYILQYDASYFATLADYWEAGGTPQRLSGQSIAFALVPGYGNEYDYHSMRNEDGSSRNTFSIHAGGEYRREKPIDLSWQNSLHALSYIGFLQTPRFFEQTAMRILNLNAGLVQSIGYFPNTRTAARAGYTLQFLHLFDLADSKNNAFSREGTAFKSDVFMDVSYYISPQFRLRFYYFLSCLRNNDKSLMYNDFFVDYVLDYQYYYYNAGSADFINTTRKFSQYFNLSLMYSIF